MKPSVKQPMSVEEIAKIREAATAYALGVPELKDAAMMGYAICDSVAHEVAVEVAAVLLDGEIGTLITPDDGDDGGDVWFTEKSEAFADADVEERPAPRPEAIRLRATIDAAVEKVARPAGYEVSVSRVMRFRLRDGGCENHREAHDRTCEWCRELAPVTAVLVKVTAPLSSVRERVIVVSAE